MNLTHKSLIFYNSLIDCETIMNYNTIRWQTVGGKIMRDEMNKDQIAENNDDQKKYEDI